MDPLRVMLSTNKVHLVEVVTLERGVLELHFGVLCFPLFRAHLLSGLTELLYVSF